jgi:hypothetical protein
MRRCFVTWFILINYFKYPRYIGTAGLVQEGKFRVLPLINNIGKNLGWQVLKQVNLRFNIN